MTRRVGWVKALECTFPYSVFFLGEELEPSETHLRPSVEVCLWFTLDILSDCIESSEGPT